MTQVRKRIPLNPKQASRRTAPIDRTLDAELFKALSDPTRLRLFACIAKCARACSVTEVAACCNIDLSVVSRHLTVLARAGVLATSKQGRVVSYSVRYPELTQLLRSMADAVEQCCGQTSKGAGCDKC